MLVALVLVALFCSAFGQSREERLADDRLPGDLAPTHYELQMEPHLDNESGQLFDAPSEAKIYFDVRTPTNVIILNAVGFEVEQSNVQLELDPESGVTPPVPAITSVTQNATRQFLFINLERNLEVGAKLIVTIRYTLELGFQRRGVYLIRYGGGANLNFVLTSLFRPSDFRRAFPSFDEPEYKATFDLTLLRRPDFTSISCTNILIQEGRPGGWIADTYQTTDRISPHSFSINVVNFVFREAVSSRGVVVRLWGTPEMIERTDLVTTLAPRLIDWFENFTGVNYPLQKIDHIPFRGGALTDALGVLSYPNNALYFNDGFDSVDIARQASLISQQTAQQWFGHYTTSKWWNEAWINEAFRTYFGYRPLEDILNWSATELEWYFLVSEAMLDDSLNISFPVRLNVRTPATSRFAFTRIAFFKGASVVRMFNQVLTTNTFQTAIRNFLRNNAWSTVDTDELWAEFQRQADADNIRLPDGSRLVVADRFDPWVKQQYYPIVDVTRQPDGSARLKQSIFFNPVNQTADDPSPWNYRWNIPITFYHADLPAKDTITDEWMDRQDEVVTTRGLPEAGKYVVANVDRNGFYRVRYDSESTALILNSLNSGNSTIPVESKAELIEDMFEIVFSENAVETAAMEFTKFLGSENEFLAWSSSLRYTQYMDVQLSREPFFDSYMSYWRGRVDPIYAVSGADRPGAGREVRIGRRLLGMQMTQTACAYGNPTCVSRARQTFNRWRDNEIGRIRADIDLAVKCTTIANGNVTDWDDVAADVFLSFNLERQRNIASLACTTNSAQMQSYWDRTINREFPIGATNYIAATDLGRDISWTWLKDNWNITGNRKFTLMLIIAQGFYLQSEIDDLNAHIARYPPNTGNERLTYELSLYYATANQEWHRINTAPLRDWLRDNQDPETVSFSGGRAPHTSPMWLYHTYNMMQRAAKVPRSSEIDIYATMARDMED